MEPDGRRAVWAYAWRRAAAFAIDLALAQCVAQLLLNLADLPLPAWAPSLFLPVVFAAGSILFLSRGPDARTPGKRWMGLAIRTREGGRPTAAAVRLRSVALAALLLLDWQSLLSGAMANVTTFGTVLAVSIACGVTLLSLAAVRQVMTGALTPHDALAGTVVTRSASGAVPAALPGTPRLAAGAVSATAAVVLVVGLFTMGLLYVVRASSCPVCRLAEHEIATRYLLPARVAIEPAPDGAANHLQTTIWMPALSALRPAARNGALRVADSLVTSASASAGYDTAGRSTVQELMQLPLVVKSVDYAAPDSEDVILLTFGLGGILNLFHYDLGVTFTFQALPIEAPPS